MISQFEKIWTRGLIPMIEPEIVSEIISRIADLALVVSGKGVVLSVLSNPNSKMQLGFSRWEGGPLIDQLSNVSVGKFQERLSSFLNEDNVAVRPVDLNHKANADQQAFPIRYSFHRIGTDGALLMLGQDLRPIAEMQQQLVAAQIALERDYEAQREYDTRLRVLMATTSDGTVFMSASSGRIVDCNGVAMALFGKTRDELIGATLSEFLDPGGDENVMNTLAQIAGSQLVQEMTLRTKSGHELTVRPTVFRATREQMLVCQMTNVKGAPMRVDGLDQHLTGLFENGPDGIVFVNKAGTILSANNAFLGLTEVVNSQSVRGRNITDYLGRGSVDLNVMSENASRTGAMRLYATRLIAEHGLEIPVEIATTHLKVGGDQVFIMVLRDASRAEAVRKSQPQITDADMRSVTELIGTQTLKGIVAKTTDVIEKTCIETAIELTSNNRVAAAEMLGLSRQSLYVKLRKYDLIKKE
jgi:transcriptional regulator PpsR